MSNHRLDLAMSVFLFLLGIGVIIGAFGLGIWSPIGPSSGFYPLAGGLLLSSMSAMNFWRALKGLELVKGEVRLRDLASILAVVVVVGIYISIMEDLGMFLPLPIFLVLLSLCVTWRIELKWLLQLFVGSVLFTVGCYYVFKVFLHMLLPTGPFGF